MRHSVASSNLHPFLKWAGGKGQLLPEIRKIYPTELGKEITKYAEPFVGGGAVLFDILSSYALEEIYISDTNPDLINVYRCVRDNIDELIEKLFDMQSAFLPLTSEERKFFYYDKRRQFNILKARALSIESNDVERASLLLFLNRTCFNGLYRVNSKGEYNVPMGAYKNPSICDSENLMKVSRRLKDIQICCSDYSGVEKFIDHHTFVYFDPPYRPLNQTSRFTAYTENSFEDPQQVALSKFIIRLAHEKGALVAASNSDPHNTNAEDDFFDVLYQECTIRRIAASRMINANAASRGKISELLITTY